LIILGIDTSCDDTSFSILKDRHVLSELVSSQTEVHSLFGGVVPEIASRRHLEVVDRLFLEVLRMAGLKEGDIEVVAVTAGPGLVGSLLVGLSFAKGLCCSLGIPLVCVNHVHAHAMSIFLERDVEFPFVALVASGGHTVILLLKDPLAFEVIGTTRDDAAGEAFDKAAKFFGLPYPGGTVIEELAKEGMRDRVTFPRPMVEERSHDMSFSGLKTALINYVKKNGLKEASQPDILASFQEAIVETLTTKTLRAARDCGVGTVVVGGGVAANKRLREVMVEKGRAMEIEVLFPSKRYCLDNASMVALTGYFFARAGRFSPLDAAAFSRMAVRTHGAKGA